MITTVIEIITPELAAAYLRTNSNNRNLRPGRVAYFQKLIETGEFRTTHQGIAFRPDGTLLDGQHRLAAIVASGATVEVMVSRNVPPSAFDGIDTPEKRSMGDILFGSEKHGQSRSEIAMFILRECGVRRPTPAEVSSIYSMKGHLFRDLLEFCSTSKRSLSSAPVRAACCYWMDNDDHDRALIIYRDLVLLNFDSLPVVGKSFAKQVLGSNKRLVAGNASRDLFSRAMCLFDPGKADVSRIQVNDVTTHTKMLRKWIGYREASQCQATS